MLFWLLCSKTYRVPCHLSLRGRALGDGILSNKVKGVVDSITANDKRHNFATSSLPDASMAEVEHYSFCKLLHASITSVSFA